MVGISATAGDGHARRALVPVFGYSESQGRTSELPNTGTIVPESQSRTSKRPRIGVIVLREIPTKRPNEQVKRNRERFPDDFMFRLTREEVEASNRSQSATGSQKHRDPRFPPYAFTEHGAIMAATGKTPTPDTQKGDSRRARIPYPVFACPALLSPGTFIPCYPAPTGLIAIIIAYDDNDRTANDYPLHIPPIMRTSSPITLDA